jgi:hypothetical protein
MTRQAWDDPHMATGTTEMMEGPKPGTAKRADGRKNKDDDGNRWGQQQHRPHQVRTNHHLSTASTDRPASPETQHPASPQWDATNTNGETNTMGTRGTKMEVSFFLVPSTKLTIFISFRL